MSMKRPLQDRVARAVVRGLGNLPTSVKRVLGSAPICIDGQVLSAETQMGRRLLARTVTETFATLQLHEGRAQEHRPRPPGKDARAQGGSRSR